MLTQAFWCAPTAQALVGTGPSVLLLPRTFLCSIMDARSFWGLCEEAPSVTRKIMKALAQRLRKVEKAPT